jgi:hypothetical protein
VLVVLQSHGGSVVDVVLVLVLVVPEQTGGWLTTLAQLVVVQSPSFTPQKVG